MIKYKISKGYTETNNRCDCKFGCWSRNVKKVKLITSINCSCCPRNHTQTYYLCDKHIVDIEKNISSHIFVGLKLKTLADPIVNELFIKPRL
jgi:hypothetical protein